MIATGDEAQRRRALEQFARDYNWEDAQPRIEDPGYAADEILSQLGDDVLEEDQDHLREMLVESARRENARREVRS